MALVGSAAVERQDSRESIFRESAYSEQSDSILQLQAWYCTERAEIAGTLTLTSSLFFEPDPGDLHVHQNGLGYFQVFVDFRDVAGAGAVTAPADSLPYVDELADFRSVAFFVQIELRRLSGKNEISDLVSFPLLFRVPHGRDAHRLAEAIIGQTSATSGNFFRGHTLTSVPFSSEAVVENLAGVPRRISDHFETPQSSSRSLSSPSVSPAIPEISRVQLQISARDTAGVEWRGRHGENLPFLLTSEIVGNLRDHLPLRLRFSDVTLGFSPKIHGISLQHFIKHQEFLFGEIPDLPGILVVQDSDGKIFGAFLTGRWRVQSQGRFYGSGESFVFELVNAEEVRSQRTDASDSSWLCVYSWTRKNELFQFADERRLVVGGGTKDAAIVIKEGFQFGISGESETYDNPCLASNREFEIRDFEYWILTTNDD